MEEQYVMINPPNADVVPPSPPPPVAPNPPPVAPNPPPPPAAAGAGPDGTSSTMLGSKTNLVSDVKTAADPSAMPEAPDFGGGQSTYTSPVPLVDSKSQKDTITEKTGKKRSVVWTAIFGVLAIFFLAVTIVGALGVFGPLKPADD